MPQLLELNKQRFSPSTGQTVNWADSDADIMVIIDNAATLADLTIPFRAVPIDGQLMLISARSEITNLTLSSVKPIRGSISTIAGGSVLGWIFDTASDAWFTYYPSYIQKSQAGLANVDNTSDADKPVSNATQTALNAKLASNGNGGSLSGMNKSQVGLSNVDNTSDANKPISTATQTALDGKLATNGNGSALTGLTKSQVGLANVDNTSDANKPVSSATQTALDAKQATLVSGTNIKTVGGVSLLGAGDVPLGGGSVGGTNKQFQYNNNSSFGGVSNVENENGNLSFVPISTPSSVANRLLNYSKSFAGRLLPTILGPSAIETSLQVGLHGNNILLVSPANGTTAPTITGGVLTTVATISHQQTISSANRWQATRTTRFQTSTTAGNQSGMRTAYTQWFVGNAAGFGGFFFRSQLGMNINLNGGQKFVGLCASTGALAGDPSALTNMCGMGYDAADASSGNWFFMRNDGAGTATKVDLGTDAARNTTHGYDLIMFLAPNSSILNVLIINLHTGVIVLNTNYNTDIPAVNTGMAFKADVRNGAVAAADNLEVAKVYIETDY